MEKHKKILLALLVAFLLLVAGGVSYYFYTRSPVYSLKMIKEAVKNHDWEGFQKYVDVDSLVSQIVDEAIKVTKEEETNTPKNEFEELGESIAMGLIEVMKPRLKEEIKESLRKAVESGSFKKSEGIVDKTSSFLDPKHLSIGNIKREGKIAEVTILSSNKDTPVILKMRSKDGYWQLFEIANLKELIKE